MSNCPIPGLDWVLAESGDTLPADTPRLFRRHGSNKTTFRTKGSEDITVSGRGSGQFWTEKTLKLSLPSEPGTMAKNVVDINRDNYGKGFRTASAWLLTDGPGGQSRWADDHDLFVSFELDDSSPDDVMDARNLASRIATPHDGGEPVTLCRNIHGKFSNIAELIGGGAGWSLEDWAIGHDIEFDTNDDED